MIRDIGTEFWSEWVVPPISADPREMRILYKVVDIIKVANQGNYRQLVDAEKLEPIKVEYRLLPDG